MDTFDEGLQSLKDSRTVFIKTFSFMSASSLLSLLDTFIECELMNLDDNIEINREARTPEALSKSIVDFIITSLSSKDVSMVFKRKCVHVFNGCIHIACAYNLN